MIEISSRFVRCLLLFVAGGLSYVRNSEQARAAGGHGLVSGFWAVKISVLFVLWGLCCVFGDGRVSSVSVLGRRWRGACLVLSNPIPSVWSFTGILMGFCSLRRHGVNSVIIEFSLASSNCID